MAVDISTELAAILAAIYGEEVRGSIHDALLKMNNNLNTAIGSQLLTIDDTLTATDPHAAADSKKVGDVIQTISGIVAYNYNPASSYAVGDYCSYGYSPTTVGRIYRCTTAINGGEAWNPDHWQRIDFANRIGEIIQYLFNKIATIYDPTKAYSVGDFCTYGNNKSDPGRIYRCNTAIGSGGETWNASHWTLVNLTDVVTVLEDKIADIREDLTNGLGIVVPVGTYSTDQSVLFTKDDVPTGMYIYYKFTTTAKAAWIVFRNASGESLFAPGKHASSSGDTEYEGVYILPDNFNDCIVRVASGGSITIKYFVTEWLPSKLFESTVKSRGMIGNTNVYNDVDNLPLNSIFTFYGDGLNIQHKPATIDGVFSVITLGSKPDSYNGALQIAFSISTQNIVLYRTFVSGSWKEWKTSKETPQIIKVRSDGTGDCTSVVDAVVYTMNNPTTKEMPIVIDIGEGTFDLSSVATMVENGELDSRGLFIMPYVTIRGKGQDKTKLVFEYSGMVNSTMTQVSAFNVVYESAIKDLSIECKNIRYTFHADYPLNGEAEDDTNELLNNNTFVMENVKAVHNGFDSGLSPTYKVPSAWGQGLRTGLVRKFVNCRFIAKEATPWFCHDRLTNTKGSQLFFDGCEFIPYNDSDASLRFVSWGSDIRNVVNIKNCVVRTYIILGVTTTYNTDAKIDYYVEAKDCDCLIYEDRRNDSHKAMNYYNYGVLMCKNESGDAITKLQPVKVIGYNIAKANTANGIQGIALNDAAIDEMVNVKIAGAIDISTSFSAGKRIGYSDGAWVEDANGFLRVMNGTYCRFVN